MGLKRFIFALLSLYIASIYATSVFAVENDENIGITVTEDVSGSENIEDLTPADEEELAGKQLQGLPEESDYLEDFSSVDPGDDVCGFEVPDPKTYDAQVVAVRRKLRVELNEIFRVKVFIKNTGNMPWFSNASKCLGPKMSLGTDLDRDRESVFYSQDLGGWESPNRIKMDQYRVDPDGIASFTFYSKADDDADIYKEYLTPVLKDITWFDSARFSFEIMVGDTGDSAMDVRKKLSYANTSGSVSDIDLNAEKLITIDLSEQNMYVTLGDYLVRKFRVSSGLPSKPTPVGNFSILLKQEVRIGSKPPHFIMPKFQMFKAGGFGLHALPSLANDRGIFWTEAKRDIGRPVSHGCVRVLSDEAAWLFEFTDIGTKVIIKW